MAKRIQLIPQNFVAISNLINEPVEELVRIAHEAARLGQSYYYEVDQHGVHLFIELGEGSHHASEEVDRQVQRPGLYLL